MRWQQLSGWCMWGMALLLLIGCRPQAKQETPNSDLSGNLIIQAPEETIAGKEIVVTVRSISSSEDGTPVTLLTMNGLGQHIYQSVFEQQIASFTLAEADSSQAGFVTLTARSGSAWGEASLQILPAEAVSPLFLLVGPRTVVADNRQENMAVVVTNDAYGNALFDGTVALQVLFADGTLTKQSLPINHLVGWAWLDGTTTEGDIRLAASIDEASAPENNLVAVADSPESFTISANPDSADADGRQLITLRSDVIHDANGNVVPDGTLVTFIAETSAGEMRRIPTYVIDGIAQAPLQAPQTAGVFSVWALTTGVKSETLTIHFSDKNIARDFRLSASTDAALGAIILTAGPIAGTLGQLMPDGTQVNFSLTDPAGNRQWLVAETQNGYAEIDVRLLTLRAGIYTIEASIGSQRETLAFSVP